MFYKILTISILLLGCTSSVIIDVVEVEKDGGSGDSDQDIVFDSDTESDFDDVIDSGDTETDTNVTNDTDSASDVDTTSDSDSGNDSDTALIDGEACLEDNECQSDHCNDGLCCEVGNRCCETDVSCDGFRCDVTNYVCESDCLEGDNRCIEGYHCDDGSCYPDNEFGLDCNEGSDCVSGYCDLDVGLCCSEDVDCCSSQKDCGEAHKGICWQSQCVGCDVPEDDQCAVQMKTKPACNKETGQCVECLSNEDCRSPIGVCTPDNTCTCWVKDDPRAECITGSCPSGMVCAEDYVTHYVCLARCATSVAPQSGLSCKWRLEPNAKDKALVWVPVTSCFAFNQVGQSCSGKDSDCAVASGDGKCRNLTCTYWCEDESGTDQHDWCVSGVCDNFCRDKEHLSLVN